MVGITRASKGDQEEAEGSPSTPASWVEAWKANPQNPPEGEDRLHAAGGAVELAAAGGSRAAGGRRVGVGNRPQPGPRTLEVRAAWTPDAAAPETAAPSRSPPGRRLTSHFPPPPYQQKAAGPTCPALRPPARPPAQPGPPSAAAARRTCTRLPRELPHLGARAAPARRRALRHGGCRACAVVTWPGRREASSAARPSRPRTARPARGLRRRKRRGPRWEFIGRLPTPRSANGRLLSPGVSDVRPWRGVAWRLLVYARGDLNYKRKKSKIGRNRMSFSQGGQRE